MIGVCLKYYHENYGGMLQAFSTICMLEKNGVEYELIRYKKNYTIVRIVQSLPRMLNGVLLNDKYESFMKRIGMYMHPELKKNDAIRMEAFRSFKEKYFTKLSPVYVGYEELCENSQKYKAFITGSDQLWSPAGLPTNFYNLQFVADDVKKISYASSFGVKQIPWYQKKRTAAFLNRLQLISMREERGSEIVKELIGRDVPTILDPVFYFDKEDWESLIPYKKEIEQPYIFAYFLGKSEVYRSAVKKAADELGGIIVTLPHLDQYVKSDDNFGDIRLYDVSPERFLNLLRGAAYVCTDSYHGSCFSIINRKPFVIFNRYSEQSRHSKNSRIDTLCDSLSLQRRRYQTGCSVTDILNEKIAWDMVYDKLEILRRDTEQYIDMMLEGIR